MPPTLGQPTLRRSYLLIGWILLAALPVLYIAAKVIATSRNIVFWDEFDTALAFILRIDAGADGVRCWSGCLRSTTSIER
jgi:hypothetical protein